MDITVLGNALIIQLKFVLIETTDAQTVRAALWGRQIAAPANREGFSPLPLQWGGIFPGEVYTGIDALYGGLSGEIP